MADIGWLRSSPAKISTNGSLSLSAAGSGSTSSFNGSNENLFDILQGRLGGTGGGSIFGPPSIEHSSTFLRSPADHDIQRTTSDHDGAESSSLLKAEDENILPSPVDTLTVGMQPNLWPVADTSTPLLGGLAIGTHHQGLYNAAVHMSTMNPAPGLVPVPVVDGSCQFPSFTSPKTHDPSSQLQALREFMAYGNSNIDSMGVGSGAGHGSQHHGTGGLASHPMFLHLGDESCSPGSSPLLQLPGLPAQVQRTHATDNSSTLTSKPDIMAYRALCQSELFATERSPHRTQFQRENHILAERQRREEMNEKFSALRAMIPKATKKDKASIVGDTIGYVLELQKTLKHLQACKASRKSYFKLLRKRRSSKIDDEAEKSTTGPENTTPDLDSSTAPVGAPDTAAYVESPSEDLICDDQRHLKSDQKMKQSDDEDMDLFDDPIMSGNTAAEDDNTCGDSFEQKTNDGDVLENLPEEGVCNSEVDVQNLGEQAVIKIVCTRSSGLVLRVLLALDECKVDVLQSNVTTVAEKSVQFITVQISSGLSCTTEEMIAVLHKASSSTSSNR